MKKKSLSLSNQADNENSNLIKITEVDGTPFRIVTENEESGKELRDVKIIMGDHVVMQNLEDEEEAQQIIEDKPWGLILTAGAIYNEYINKIRKEENEQ